MPQNKKFFSRLSYSFGNEDWSAESKALKIKPGDHAVCITASGDRPLHLLLDDCARVTTVDLNRTQNFLLSLKIAAMRHFDFESYKTFLGTSQHQSCRVKDMNWLSRKMQDESGLFWLKHDRMIKKGVIYQGRVEQICKKNAQVMNLFRGHKVKKLFSMQNLDEQRRFVREEWNTFLWRKTFDIILAPFTSRLLINDPGLYDHLGNSISAGTYILNRMNACLGRCLARKNPLLSLMFLGTVPEEAHPPYLTRDGVNIIKDRLDRLHIKHKDIIHFLEESPDNTYDCFSLSDVVSYINKERFEKLLKEVCRTAKPGARFCFRQFLSDHSIPHTLAPHFKRDAKLENQLEEEELCFVYRFMTGEIAKS